MSSVPHTHASCSAHPILLGLLNDVVQINQGYNFYTIVRQIETQSY